MSAPQSYHIDVVPGRFIENTNDVFLHIAYGEKERMQTNLKTHIDHIANSGCVPIIRMTKIWSHRNNIQIKTFVLELFVVRALSGSRSEDDLKRSFLKVLEMLKDEFKTIQLVDPANTNNIVSQLVSSSEKAIVAQAAEGAFNKVNDSDDPDEWKSIFNENDLPPKHSVTPAVTGNNLNQGGFTPRSPWGV